MNDNRTRNKLYTEFALGASFLLLGILLAIPGDQNGIFLLGIGIIFLGLNLLRRMKGIPVNLFSTLVGVLALGGGLYALAQPVLNFPRVEVGFIPLALIVVGLYILIPAPRHTTDLQE